MQACLHGNCLQNVMVVKKIVLSKLRLRVILKLFLYQILIYCFKRINFKDYLYFLHLCKQARCFVHKILLKISFYFENLFCYWFRTLL
jgi:hypothetical protein